ncbi:group 3 secretory phospholipase A2 [Polymixia lowei]
MEITPLFFVIFISSPLRWIPAEAINLCAWTQVMSNAEKHYSFLQIDQSKPQQHSPSLRLYHSVWSKDRALVKCAWTDDAAVIRDYLSLCKEKTNEFSEHRNENLNINPMFAADGLCVAVTSPTAIGRQERTGMRQARSVGDVSVGLAFEKSHGQGENSGTERHQRVKRGFIVPGTLWCGSGNKAPSYADLGVFAETDSCCREHDQCKDTILSFQSNFGVFNSHIFTMSHCDCDNRFHSCLMEANDSISDVVGYTFFNLLKMYCFEFTRKLQCTQRNWFGMCKESTMSLYAEVHPPTNYESIKPTEDPTLSTQARNISEAPRRASSDARLFSSSGPASTTPALSSGSGLNITLTTDARATDFITSERGTASMSASSNDLDHDLSINNISSTAHTTKPSLANGLTPSQHDASNSSKQLLCDVYRDLDECRFKILPQQKRYGLHNPEHRTMYHCNCTTRLSQSLAQQEELNEVQALLLEYVSQSCFLARTCTVGKICTAAVVKPTLSQPGHLEDNDTEKRRHLQALRLKVRGFNSKRAKRKFRAVRLHKLCVRVTLPKAHKTTEVRSHDTNRSASRLKLLI